MMPNILVVEDEPAIMELLKVNLVDAGYEVREAGDAETANVLLKESLPDLVLLDWMLPGQSGLAFAKQLRADPRTKELPVIMVTARTDEADRVAGLEAWVDDYVTKPFSPRELKARIKSVLRRAIALKDPERYRGSRFRVYEREGERCPTAGCTGTIARVWQNGRSTFYCPVCQK